MRVLRWLLVAPSAFLGYPIGFFLGLGSIQLVTAICRPREHLVSGVCSASWSLYVEVSVLSFAASIGAVVWVVLTVLVAPSHRAYVAWVAFAIGAAFVTWLLVPFAPRLVVPNAIALLSGAIAAQLAAARFKNAT